MTPTAGRSTGCPRSSWCPGGPACSWPPCGCCGSFGLLVFVASTVVIGRDERDVLLDTYLYSALAVGAAVLAVLRPVLVRRGRALWTVGALALVVYAAGDVLYSTVVVRQDPEPYPSVADALWLSYYVLAVVLLVGLLRTRARGVSASTAVDGVVVGLGAAAATAAVSFDTIRRAAEGTALETAATLGYPVGALVLLGTAGAALAVMGWRVGLQWWALVLGGLVFAVADTVYAYLSATTGYERRRPAGRAVARRPGPAGGRGLAEPAPAPGTRSAGPWPRSCCPLGFAVAALGVLVLEHFQRLSLLALVLAAATVVAALLRITPHRLRGAPAGHHPRAGPHRRADRAAQPPPAGPGAARGRWTGGARSACSCSTSTASRTSTTPSATPRATGCCWRWPGAWRPRSARASWPAGSAATSSRSCCRAWAGRRCWSGPARVAALLDPPVDLGHISIDVSTSVGAASVPHDATDASVAACARPTWPCTGPSGAAPASRCTGRPPTPPPPRTTRWSRSSARASPRTGVACTYVPVVGLADGRLRRVRAVPRWEHPRLGAVPPRELLEMVERTGMVRELTTSVLDRALADRAAWAAAGQRRTSSPSRCPRSSCSTPGCPRP